MNQDMSWEAIAARDPFLAGAIAARGYEWWDRPAPESQAESVGLSGEAREKFLAGWQFELDEQEKARTLEREKELNDLLEEASGKGDPAAS